MDWNQWTYPSTIFYFKIPAEDPQDAVKPTKLAIGNNFLNFILRLTNQILYFLQSIIKVMVDSRCEKDKKFPIIPHIQGELSSIIKYFMIGFISGVEGGFDVDKPKVSVIIFSIEKKSYFVSL